MLVVGGGPAGLEAARALGKRGYRVQLAEAESELGRPGQPGEPPAGPRRVGPGSGLAAGPDPPDARRVDVPR